MNPSAIAHDAVLAWCKAVADAGGNEIARYPVMRTGMVGAPCGVLDMGRSEQVPGGYEWEMRSKRIVVGDTWVDVFFALRSLGEQV